jgi:hypothetical protein
LSRKGEGNATASITWNRRRLGNNANPAILAADLRVVFGRVYLVGAASLSEAVRNARLYRQPIFLKVSTLLKNRQTN